jgi:cell shape-determining protein MreC
MMNSYRRNKGRRALLIATVFALAVLGVDVISGGKIREWVRVPASAAWRWSAGVVHGIGGSGFFSSRAGLARENAALRQEIADLKERTALYSALRADYDELRALLDVVEEGRGITAPILSSASASPYGTFLVGAGRADAITYGSTVLSSGGFVVGRITDVDNRRSVVTELLAPGALTDALLRGAGVSIEGQGGGNGRVKIPRGLAVLPGDVLTSAVFGSKPVAVVGEVESDPGSAFSTVYVRLPQSVSSLRFVYIVPAENE